jgi:MoaA/NifB/PqqE/SkfB family radical SAM enzyme
MDKEFLLTKSKSFCILPWVHIHTSPIGKIYPCCISGLEMQKNTLREAFHSTEMNQLRSDMLNEIQNPVCNSCYNMDGYSQTSREHHNRIFSHKFDDIVTKTKDDGSLNDFHLSYFDIRFSNICNMKCRMCNSDYSSQWAKETNKPILNGNDVFLKEVLDSIDTLELAYFAGGEPLITDQHYVILEELIRKNKDIPLIYSTNASTIKYKNKDLLDLWKHFTNIELRVSMDHYGEKAEYIRHGTNWDLIESNIIKFKSLSNVNLALLTVVNLYNYSDLPEIYNYILEKELLKQKSNWILFNMTHPTHLTALMLPKNLKNIANENITRYAESLSEEFTHIKSQLTNLVKYVQSQDTYDELKDKFIDEVHKLDKLRGESYVSTFPKLASMLNG